MVATFLTRLTSLAPGSTCAGQPVQARVCLCWVKPGTCSGWYDKGWRRSSGCATTDDRAPHGVAHILFSSTFWVLACQKKQMVGKCGWKYERRRWFLPQCPSMRSEAGAAARRKDEDDLLNGVVFRRSHHHWISGLRPAAGGKNPTTRFRGQARVTLLSTLQRSAGSGAEKL